MAMYAGELTKNTPLVVRSVSENSGLIDVSDGSAIGLTDFEEGNYFFQVYGEFEFEFVYVAKTNNPANFVINDEARARAIRIQSWPKQHGQEIQVASDEQLVAWSDRSGVKLVVKKYERSGGGGGSAAFGGSAVFGAQAAKTSGLNVYLFPPLASGEGILGWQLHAQARAGAIAAVDATKDLYTNAAQTQGIRVTHVGRPGAQGNGWGFFRGHPVGTIEIEEASTNNNWLLRGTLTGGFTAAQFKTLIDAETKLSSVYFGGETGTSTPFATLTNDQIFGGLVQFGGGADAIPAEVISASADVDTSIVTVRANTSDTLEDIADVISPVAGLGVSYFGGADVTTVAARPLPWTEVFDLATIVGGPQGRFPVYIYRNSQTPITTAPTGGSYVISTGALVAPTGWSTRRNTPSNTQVTYIATAYINPGTNTNTSTPTWSIPVEYFDISAVDARIAPYARILPSGEIADAQIPSGIMRDLEFTANAVRALLGLSATEVNDLFTGATISGQIITYTQNDGTTVAITIPSTSAVMTDGVVDGASFSADGTTLTLTLTEGNDIVISIPSVLRAGDGVAESLTFSSDGSTLTIGLTVGADIVANVPSALRQSGSTPVTSDHTRYAALSEDSTFTAPEFTAAGTSSSSQTNELIVPAFTANRYLAFAIPNDQPDLGSIQEAGSSFDSFTFFERILGTIDIAGVVHKVWRSTDALLPAAEKTWEIA